MKPDAYAYQIWVCSECEGECETGSAEVGDLVCLSCGNEYELRGVLVGLALAVVV